MQAKELALKWKRRHELLTEHPIVQPHHPIHRRGKPLVMCGDERSAPLFPHKRQELCENAVRRRFIKVARWLVC
jgi:hypothetical protein